MTNERLSELNVSAQTRQNVLTLNSCFSFRIHSFWVFRHLTARKLYACFVRAQYTTYCMTLNNSPTLPDWLVAWSRRHRARTKINFQSAHAFRHTKLLTICAQRLNVNYKIWTIFSTRYPCIHSTHWMYSTCMHARCMLGFTNEQIKWSK